MTPGPHQNVYSVVVATLCKCKGYFETFSFCLVFLFQIVTNFTDRVLGWGFQFTDHVKDLVSYDGKNQRDLLKLDKQTWF